MQKKRVIAAMLISILILSLAGGALAAGISASANPEMLDGDGASAISITVANDGDSLMENISISSPYGYTVDSSSAPVIAPGNSATYTATVNVTAAMLGTDLGFTVSWTENGELKSAPAAVTIAPGNVSYISAERTVSAKQAAPGETITVTYTVTNISTVNVSKLNVLDKELAGSTPIMKDISLAPGQMQTVEHQYKMGYETVVSLPEITYYIDGDKEIKTYTGIAEQALGMVNTKLTVEVEQGTPTETGCTFTVVVTNNGNQTMKNIQVTDEEENKLTEERFTLSVGEKKVITHTVPTDGTRNVVFTVKATTGSGENYEDSTKSYPVRKYVDPSLIGLDFSAEVTSPLSAAGSVSVKFTVNNTGELTMHGLVLTETEAGELYRTETVEQGLTEFEQIVYVGQPRDMQFTLSINDPSENEYTYTAFITAAYIVEDPSAAPLSTSTDIEEAVESLGADIGNNVSGLLSTALIVLACLTAVALVALIWLSVLERKERRRLARKKAARERRERELASRELSGAGGEDGSTIVKRRPRN